MEIKRYAQMLWRWSWLIIICALAAGAVATMINAQKTQRYSASTTLLVNAAARGTAPFSESTLRTSGQLLGTYAELLVKRPVLEKVIDNLDLSNSPGGLRGKIKVTIIPDTLLLLLTVEDTDPQRAADIANELVKVLNQQEEMLLDNPFASYREALHVVEEAQRGSPVNQRAMESLILAIVLGMAVAVGIALLVEYLDDTVKSSIDVERISGMPPLATIAHISGADLPDKLVTIKDQRSATAEGYRMLQAAIEFAAVDKPISTILVTSSEPNEGKSTTTANLAVALAQAGKQVILVDMDLRRPVLHKFFRRTNQRGVTTALALEEGETLHDHLVSTGIEHLQLMASGPLPANPARLFVSPRMAELIEELREMADVVIFDTPSVLTVVDTVLLARFCDASFLVVRAGAIRSDVLKRACDRIAQSGTLLLGLILNRAARSAGAHHYYYGDDGRRKPFGSWRRVLRRLRKRNANHLAPVAAESGERGEGA